MNFYEKELNRIETEWKKSHPERVERFTKQYLEQGFSDEDTWSLDSHLTDLILPRLQRFKELAQGVIVIDWPLDDIIVAFEKLSEEEHGQLTTDDFQVIEKGLKAFAEHYRRHWW